MRAVLRVILFTKCLAASSMHLCWHSAAHAVHEALVFGILAPAKRLPQAEMHHVLVGEHARNVLRGKLAGHQDDRVGPRVVKPGHGVPSIRHVAHLRIAAKVREPVDDAHLIGLDRHAREDRIDLGAHLVRWHAPLLIARLCAVPALALEHMTSHCRQWSTRYPSVWMDHHTVDGPDSRCIARRLHVVHALHGRTERHHLAGVGGGGLAQQVGDAGGRTVGAKLRHFLRVNWHHAPHPIVVIKQQDPGIHSRIADDSANHGRRHMLIQRPVLIFARSAKLAFQLRDLTCARGRRDRLRDLRIQNTARMEGRLITAPTHHDHTIRLDAGLLKHHVEMSLHGHVRAALHEYARRVVVREVHFLGARHLRDRTQQRERFNADLVAGADGVTDDGQGLVVLVQYRGHHVLLRHLAQGRDDMRGLLPRVDDFVASAERAYLSEFGSVGEFRDRAFLSGKRSSVAEDVELVRYTGDGP